jgi:benzoate/toluate 1,2-dioxygenase reductase subunit
MTTPTTDIQTKIKLTTTVLERRWLSEQTFELILSRPREFTFKPGQRICFYHGDVERDYSLVSSPQDDHIVLCVRRVEEGLFSPYLAAVELGSELAFTGPAGYFSYLPSERQAVFVATGTGVAPFLSMAKSGVEGFYLLHGVRKVDELYYKAFWPERSFRYIACLSDALPSSSVPDHAIHGRVTDYLENNLPKKAYDFYLCGRSEMIRDAIYLIDEMFPGSFIRTEIYF